MKNVNMTINSNAITSLAPPMQQPAPLPVGYTSPAQEYLVSFSVRFDNEDEAIAFAKFMLNNIEAFKSGER